MLHFFTSNVYHISEAVKSIEFILITESRTITQPIFRILKKIVEYMADIYLERL